ncbi:MAG TPA: LptF/LptG family permease [Anaeromyxobacteraceae bacterium]|nr:LptF/LptG family permease [Anaeromyxobacteraceae bacterium]
MTLFLHIARRALAAFTGALVAVVLLFLVVEASENANLFRGEGWLAGALEFYLNRAAAVAWQTAPAAMLLGASLAASGLRTTREYDAMRALGFGPWRVAAPILAVAGLVAVGMIAFDDLVAAGAAARADEIVATRFQGGSGFRRWHEPKRWFRGRGGRRIYDLRGAVEGGGFERVTILELTDDFHLERRIDAARMLPGPSGDWILEDGEERTFWPEDAFRMDGFERRSYRFDEDPEAFAVRPGSPAQMRRALIGAQIAVRRRLGLATTDYELEWQRKLAYPCAAVPAALVALALALRRDRRGNVTASLVESVGVSVVFWGLQGLAWSLGRSGRLGPAAAAWAPDAVLLASGLWGLRRWR